MSSSRRSLLAGLGCCLVANSVPATRASAATKQSQSKADMPRMTLFCNEALSLMKAKQQFGPLRFDGSPAVPNSNVQGSDRTR